MIMLNYPEPAIVWVSECCTAPSRDELDMSSILFGGPLGFCSSCYDNCIFIPYREVIDEDEI